MHEQKLNEKKKKKKNQNKLQQENNVIWILMNEILSK